MTDGLCKHRLRVCSKCVEVTNISQRVSDEINLRIVFVDWGTLVRSCMAFRLDDGSTDGVLYPDRATALRYQLRPCGVFYFRSNMGGVNPRDCELWLRVQREAYRSDRLAWIDPESPDLIISTRARDRMKGETND